MRKKILLFIIMFLIMPISVFADSIYSIDMKIDISKEGTANVIETWDVKADSGSEWYKTMYELNNSELTNYKVLMDGKELEYQENWDVSGTLSEKKGYYGINNTAKGIELCFGKSDFKRHKFTVSYTLSNYIFNTSDSQVLAWVIFPKVETDYFSAEITSYYQFSDTLDVWGYGYKGYAYVKDGKIMISSEGSLNDDYVSVLAKFPLDTFTTTNVDSRYNSFNDVYEVAEEGTFEYDYGDTSGSSSKTDIKNLITGIFYFLIFTIPFALGIRSAITNGYGYSNNKVINKKDTPMFREIPCNKDIYYANALIKLNNFDYKESNIFGAIILKWVKENKIGFSNELKGIFNKETSVIDLTKNPTFDNDKEKELFDIMYEASGDGLLETKELEKWCRKHYTKFFNLFKKIESDKINGLKTSGHIYIRNNKEECKKKNVMDDSIYEDSKKLYGMKLYLNEFSKMDTKEVMEVHLWDEYLMFAYLFGIADKVAKQLKHMYPEVIEQQDFNYDTILFVNTISTRSVSAASSARSAAESYSSGGGGFSSGGGGGFSGGFSGGGGGSAGGR